MEPYLCVLLVLLLPLRTHQQGGCPQDFQTLLHNCYKMLPDAYTGVDAVTQCQTLGGNITSSKTEAENTLLLDLRSNASKGGERLWLGMTDKATPNEWRWMDDNSLVDPYPTSQNWRSTTKFEASPVNDRQCAWIIADDKGRFWSHTKCDNQKAITVCKIYLNDDAESKTDLTTSMKSEPPTVQNIATMDLLSLGGSVYSVSSSDLYLRLSSDVRTTSTLLSTSTDTTTQPSLSVEEVDTFSDKTTASMPLMTPSQTATSNLVRMQSHLSATAATTPAAHAPSSSQDMADHTSVLSQPALLGTENSPDYLQSHLKTTAATTSAALAPSSSEDVAAHASTPSRSTLLETENFPYYLLTHPTTSTKMFIHTSLPSDIDTTHSYNSHLPIQPSFTETLFTETLSTETTKQISLNTASGFTLTSQIPYQSTVHSVISHTPSYNCFCTCKTKLHPDVLISLQEKYSTLILKTSTLSSYVRKKISIADFRVSSNYIGVSGLLVSLVPLCLVICSDLLTCVKRK